MTERTNEEKIRIFNKWQASGPNHKLTCPKLFCGKYLVAIELGGCVVTQCPKCMAIHPEPTGILELSDALDRLNGLVGGKGGGRTLEQTLDAAEAKFGPMERQVRRENAIQAYFGGAIFGTWIVGSLAPSPMPWMYLGMLGGPAIVWLLRRRMRKHS